MNYLIIGLGIYGTSLARDLTDMGHDVVGADVNPVKVDAIKDYISTAYILDSTDEAAISVLPLKNVDLVIVSIGENFGASIKTVALLRKIGIRNIYARAIDDLHESILEGLEVQRILMPEQRAAHDLVNELALGTKVESMRLDRDRFIIRFSAPEYFQGMRYSDIDSDAMFGMSLIAASRPKNSTNILGLTAPELAPLVPAKKGSEEGEEALKVEAGDIFTCLATPADIRALSSHL